MKTILLSLFLGVTVIIADAQQPVLVSIGGGGHRTSTSMKDKNYLGNGYLVQGNVFIPFLSKGNGRFELGLLTGGTYYTSQALAPDDKNLAATYKLYNGNLGITTTQKKGASGNGFTGVLGLQAHFKAGSFILSPSFNGGYTSFKEGGFAQYASIVKADGTTQSITLSDRPEERETGWGLIPELKISYPFTERFRVYVAAGLNTGGKIRSGLRILEPQGGFNDKHTYEPSQLSAGRLISRPAEAHYQTLMFGAGVSWAVGGKTRRLKGKVIKTGDNGARQTQGSDFGEKVNAGLQPGAGALAQGSRSGIGGMAKPGGAVSSSYAAGRMNQTDSTNKMPGRLSMTPTTARQTQGMTFGEKTDTENRAITNTGYKCDYCGEVFETDDKMLDHQATCKKAHAAAGVGRTYTGGRKNEASGQNAMATPGTPIGGIVVKGGKNPGLQDMIAVSDENGAVTFAITEPGEYILQLSVPDAPGKSISEPGVKGPANKGKRKGRTYTGGRKNEVSDQNAMAAPGTPIGGIVVKGGKNPGGNFTGLTVSENGTLQFEVLEAGSYQFIIQTPGTGAQNKGKQKKEKVNERPSSGLKDTLKTNV
ncbi:hypothetical protein [Niabella drilacis]|uniref:C2H2-type domain-containing protein n=1 Tax=Niabella drilacis (strain DSM 25811 / CCM 8410 / CCUG 62505 / LMG 26954 / E90) TaxID=1285928 RepID=A0A1G6MSQ0_NIADE|nr:hypothetical protein [Niabella drilacis]SDC58254.1 hypothetical protein SAMN04487894_10314 [Niabella drilacis]